MAISDIDTATPGTNAPAGEGDDQLRQLKSDVQECFPAVDAEITNASGVGVNPPSAADFSALFTRIEALESGNAATGAILQGMCMVWSGAIVDIPAGWTLCDGTNPVNVVPVPDFTNRFVLGAGDTYTVGGMGGHANGGGTDPAGSHTHGGGSTGEHAISLAELPTALASSVSISLAASDQSDSHTSTTAAARGNMLPESDFTAPMSVNGLNGDTHSHTITTGGDHQHAIDYPLFYASAWICYVGDA